MEYYVKFQKLAQIEARRYILIVGVVAITYLMLQSCMLPYGNSLKSLLSNKGVMLSVKSGFSSSRLLVKSGEGEFNSSNVVGVVKQDGQSYDNKFIESDNESEEIDRIVQDSVTLEGKAWDETVGLDKPSGLHFPDDIQENSSRVESNTVVRVEQIVEPEHHNLSDSSLELNGSSSLDRIKNVEGWNEANIVQPENMRNLPDHDFTVLRNDMEAMGTHRGKKVRPGMPPISVVPIDMMNRRLARHLASSRKMKPQWSSLNDQDKEILDAKMKIINSTVSDVDEELYAPVFRNVSIFMRSYELMEKTLKVYVYRDGKKPIFHQPILKGLYASEL